MDSYKETILRYRVIRREIITDPAIRAEYRLNRVDPDDCWSLVYSFNNFGDAEKESIRMREIFTESRWVVKVIDAGAEEIITRSTSWF